MSQTVSQIIENPHNIGKIFRVIGFDNEFIYVLDGDDPSVNSCRAIFLRVKDGGHVSIKAFETHSRLDVGEARLQIEPAAHLDLMVVLRIGNNKRAVEDG